jgi:hypothetical protein
MPGHSPENAAEHGTDMKHPASREIFAYWDLRRGAASAPARADFDPAALRPHLGDMFVVGFDGARNNAIRVAGTRVCARFGRELKGLAFRALWHPRDRRLVDDIADAVAFEHQACVVGAIGRDAGGFQTSFEVLMLPFANATLARPSFTGLMVPLTAPASSGTGRTLALAVGSWRRIGIVGRPPAGDEIPSRRRTSRGLTLYEAGRADGFGGTDGVPAEFR